MEPPPRSRWRLRLVYSMSPCVVRPVVVDVDPEARADGAVQAEEAAHHPEVGDCSEAPAVVRVQLGHQPEEHRQGDGGKHGVAGQRFGAVAELHPGRAAPVDDHLLHPHPGSDLDCRHGAELIEARPSITVAEPSSR